jgi:CRISPR-associated protein Cas5/CasD subtype I-E
MKYLILNIEGIMMSFGEGDYWDVRGTNNFPTKSFIVGLITSGLGYERSESEKIKKISENITVACREDRHPSILRDFHTILDTMKADGKRNENAVISPHHYLSDASFTILVGLKDENIKELIIESLTDPEWPYYLGRKSCIPSRPVFEGMEIEAENDHEAFIKLKTDEKDKVYSCVGEEYKKGRMSFIKDEVISFQPRIYKDRKVYYYTISS